MHIATRVHLPGHVVTTGGCDRTGTINTAIKRVTFKEGFEGKLLSFINGVFINILEVLLVIGVILCAI